ncbi:nicotinamide-nucleotide amidohydrolase family protein [Thermodesulforhabdus norvegica]|uniref:CinA-like protein n=1 Tax=Thermodesulforhabdus norvegica TaxID=39841 RepID=A0A1I4VKT4_9BACT|nr:nicotinamide-nucleotide amidohydrolase family protein [Thermodesulforhabdus norvegica]SFN01894.1 nicotinamide-nucleotide amidase [Thermodesulforhabdus norvegica]
MKPVKGSLVVIGDEVLYGHVQDAHVKTVGRLLLKKGFTIQEVRILGDDPDLLAEALAELIRKTDFVVTTGGLGPTTDDVTCEALCRAFGLKRIPDEEYKKHFQRHLRQFGIPWKDAFEKMTHLPEGAVKLALDRPMAGFAIEVRGKPLYCLPGVPHEVEYLIGKEVLPELEKIFTARRCVVRRVIRVQGMYEWEIAERLADAEKTDPGFESVRIGYLPRPEGETWVTITLQAEDFAKAENEIKRVVGYVIDRIGAGFVSGTDDDSLEKVVGELLRKKGMKLAVAESCTGGLLAERIVSVPGASDYFDRGFVVYSNEAKEELLGVPAETLKLYGAVSERTAVEMVKGALKRSRADIAVGITGIAGPGGGSSTKPVGTVYIGYGTRGKIKAERFLFHGDRELIQRRTAHEALRLLWQELKE